MSPIPRVEFPLRAIRRALLRAVLGAAALCLAFGCTPSGGIRITPVPVDRTLEMHTVIRESAWISDKIALIDISGILENGNQGSLLSEGENPVSMTVEQLDAAAASDDVRAVILRINSPGGTVTASDVLHEEVRRFRTTTKKPVVAVLMDVAASGGYYVACASDEIIAHETSVTGSIGVIMQTASFSGALQKLGIRTDAIKSGPMKDAGSPFRDMKAEERKLFQQMIDEYYRRFVDVVATGRPKLTREQVQGLADGRVFTGRQALLAGLIDQVGSLRDGIDAAKRLARITRANTVSYGRPLDWKPNIYARRTDPGATGLTINLLNLGAGKGFTSAPRFVYLWELE